ncbi:hypothetical protein B0H11DRAFT_2031253, partial [Mycena galericulata]
MFFRDCIIFLVVLVAGALFWYPILEYKNLPPHVKTLVWKAFFCPKSRAQLWEVGEHLIQGYLRWKMRRIQECHDLGSELHRSFWVAVRVCFETWGTLDYIQKLLIVAPAAIFYGRFLIIPAARKLLVTIRNRRRRHG